MVADNYYLGLDIGTDSVGYAVTDEGYRLQKRHGEPMWGITTFEAAAQSADRRMARTARRRLDRQQMRVTLIKELFAKELVKVDPCFFDRLTKSALLAEDGGERYTLFADDNFTDADYHRQYPTIHHLIVELMNSDQPHDIRLVYLACAWLVKNRGHFLNDVDKTGISEILSFRKVYDELMEILEESTAPWQLEKADELGEILRAKGGITEKKKQMYALLNGGKKFAADADEYPYNRNDIITLLAGGTVKLSSLYFDDSYDELPEPKIELGKKDEDFDAVCLELGKDADLLRALKKIYDWAVLVDILRGHKSVSEAKVAVYEKHHADLMNLKKLVHTYVPQRFDAFFRENAADNYTAYVYNSPDNGIEKKATKEIFYKRLKALLTEIVKCKGAKVDTLYLAVLKDVDEGIFLPKQVNTDNRVIPHQLYWDELRQILEKSSQYLDFLNQVDENGLTVARKILSVFEYRIPYFVGPLRTDNNPNAWIVRKAEGKIYPWNFSEKVDLDASEETFINRLINNCTYMPGAPVLPKYSLCYAHFTVLNTINCIKVEDKRLPVEIKQRLYQEVFLKRKRVTSKSIKGWLISNGICSKEQAETLEGIDEKLTVSLEPQMAFGKLFAAGVLDESQAEAIISRITCTEDRTRLTAWLKESYPHISAEDIRYISKLKFKDFGNLSREFLCELEGASKATGEVFTIMDALWQTDCNLMELLSERFTFRENLDAVCREYYGAHPLTLNERLDEMWVGNAVKRPIIRTLEIIDDVIKAAGGKTPAKIFVEMARDASGQQKGKRTVTRKQRLLDLYKQKGIDARQLTESIEQMGDSADSRLQSDKLYLYYLQLGKCMYSGESIDLNKLASGDGTYNIEHIYPQRYIKDDSIENNEVLVLSKINGEKQDIYPIDSSIREKMSGYWGYLKSVGLLSDEKYKRLTRATHLTNEEKEGFINRQLVETRQSTKAVATILKERFPQSDIVYVKAGLVSDFRHEFDMIKSRAINNLHHAKDAYLNIVVGNVYHERFSKRWFSVDSNYSIKTKTIFSKAVMVNGKTIWNGGSDIDFVRRTVARNNAHYTRYAFTRKGAFFDLQPVKATEGLVPLKKGLDTAKYGGYNRPTAAFFALVSFDMGKKHDAMIMPVELLHSKRYLEDDVFAAKYAADTISAIKGKAVSNVNFPLGKRILKANTMLSLDGFKVCITGKSGGGSAIIVMPMMPLSLSAEDERYIKRLESFAAKLQKNPNLSYNEKFDGFNKAESIQLYRKLMDKLANSIYSKRVNAPIEILRQGELLFEKLDETKQAQCLLTILELFGSMTAGCDLSDVGGTKRAAATAGFSSSLSNWKKKYTDVRIIDRSVSGLYETVSRNLLELV